jgi:hypothetical protein
VCRSIKVLRKPGAPKASAEELNAAALQFVRKISGFRQPSQVNEQAFQLAVAEVADASRRLLDSLAKPKKNSVAVTGSPQSMALTSAPPTPPPARA